MLQNSETSFCGFRCGLHGFRVFVPNAFEFVSSQYHFSMDFDGSLPLYFLLFVYKISISKQKLYVSSFNFFTDHDSVIIKELFGFVCIQL